MTAATKRRLIGAVIAIGLVAFVYFCIVILTPTFGKVVEYADEQPPQQITRLSPLSPPDAAKAIERLAKVLFARAPDNSKLYWPEPMAIEEKESCWLVTFKAKTPIYSFCGLKQVVHPVAPALYMSIAKADLSTRIGKWCQ